MKEVIIDISPHKSIMRKISQTGYNVEDAISELIDNSIDGRDEDKVSINVTIDAGKIVVEDNAMGMNEEEAANSIRLGYSSKKNKLGEFGLGLKTSALSLGNKFRIITSMRNLPYEYILDYDLEEWLENGSWTQHKMVIKEKSEIKSSGTKIIIKELKNKINDKEINKLKGVIGIRFGPLISACVCEIKINGKECKPEEITLTSEGKKKFNLIINNEIKVYGWYGFKLAGYMKHNYGFNTFRRNRLITIYDKIGISESQRSKQIVGELHIEGVPVTHDKRGWIRISSEFKIVENAVRGLLMSSDKQLKKIISGAPANPGRVEGVVRIVNSFIGRDINELTKVKSGEILVTQMTRPDLLLAIRRASAIVTDLGGVLCHAAIVAREFNIPCIVGTQNATRILKDGMKVIVDANEGVVYESE